MPRRFLPEVQGLRAVAVLLVLVYHLNAAVLPGGYVGVDVFFVISGFLITSLLLREVHDHGRISVSQFYIRRVRRILPAATLVLLATGIATVLLLPVTRLEQAALELAASAAYIENFVLAAQTVDYLAAEEAPSPVQHFWSLAVEEQFYLVWPLLFVGWAALRSRLSEQRRELVLGGAITVIITASLICSVVMTQTDPTSAYFVPFTRMWELAAGGLLAVVLARWNLPDRLRDPVGWAGLVAIGVAAVYYNEHTAFPGYAAALPVLGAAAVIVAGEGRSRYSAGQLLSTRPARFIGDISYALYLWHWPLIVIALGMFNETELSFGTAVALGALSILLAWLTKITVEDPIRMRGLLSTGRTALAFALSGIIVVSGTAWGINSHVQQIRSVEFNPEVHLGPQALDEEDRPEELTAPPYPSVLTAEDDLPDLYEDGCQSSEEDTFPSPCVYGPDDAETTVALVGDSHAAHWSPALQEIAEDRDWQLYTFTKSSCAFTATLLVRPGEETPYTQCQLWTENVLSELHKLDPDFVITSSRAKATPYGMDGDEEEARRAVAEGMSALWQLLDEAGITVVALRDTPTTRSRIVECIDLHSPDVEACVRERDSALNGEDPQVIAAEEGDVDTPIVDLSDRFCLDDICPAVIGNVLVYRDSHHITATYSRLLSDDLAERLEEVL